MTTFPGFFPSIEVDVNQNGKADSGDTNYAFARGDNPCTVYLLAERATTACGMFKSAATVAVQQEGALKIITWKIPKGELSADGNSAHFLVSSSEGSPPTWTHYPSSSFSKPFVVDFIQR